MNQADNYTRVAEIVADVLEANECDRDAVIDRLCAGDEPLRARVLALLASGTNLSATHPFADPRIDRQRNDAERLLDESPAGPQSIGKYRVLSELGRGGMSVVYECEQDSPKRRVAVKLMDIRLSSRSLDHRLRLEAEILGRLRHECIAGVYEAGVMPRNEGGRPYFAMELVDGVPLTEFADRECLNTRQRLDLLARVADGVEHAHQKGVIHRDIKPGNILVTPAGVPKILDFGIARATDSDLKTTTMQTSVGAIMGTIAYMSPEQASADPAAVDTRSDVYSLGVLGFELLSGRLPHEVDGTPIHEAVRMIREDQPTMLATINTSMRGDIDTIVAKALEQDVDRRYASAAALAEDIRRFLADQPISARPPSTFYQLRKFSKRNSALVIGIVVTMAVLVIATAVSSLFAVRTDRALRAKTEALFARDSALDAERERNEDLKAVSHVYEHLLKQLDSAETGAAVTRLVGAAIARQSPAERSPEDRRLAEEILSNIQTPAAQASLGRDVIREVLLDPARALSTEMTKDRPNTQPAILGSLAASYRGVDSLDEAVDVYRAAIRLHNKLRVSGDVLPTMLRMNLVTTLAMAGRFEEAAVEVAKFDNREAILALDGIDRASVAAAVGFIYYEQRNNEEAQWYYRMAIEGYTSQSGSDHAMVQHYRSALANTLYKTGHHDEAEALYETVLETLSRTEGPRSPGVAVALANQSMMFLETDKYDRADESIRTAIRLGEGLWGDTWMVGNMRAKLARVLLAQRRFEQANDELVFAYDIHVQDLGAEHHRTIEIVEQASALHAAWHNAKPGKGHNAEAKRWRALIPADSAEQPD